MESMEVVVGRIGKPHGIRGEVTVELRTDEPDRRFAVGTTLAAQSPRGSHAGIDSLTIESLRWHQTTLLLGFAEVGDRNAAEALRGVMLSVEVDPDETPDDPEDYYDHQLVGLAVHDVDGTHLGEVTGVIHGAQDLLQVRAVDGRPVLVPFVSALVPEVDLAARRVVVADRPGLVTPFPPDEPRDGQDEGTRDPS